MNKSIYYTPVSRNLRRLSENDKHQIRDILLSSEQLRARNASQKYRLTRAGKSIPIFGFEYGVGSERGSERVLFTFWAGHTIVLDYISSHDYQKSWGMDQALMGRWFSALQQDEISFSEIEKEIPKLDQTEQRASHHWIPVPFNSQDELLIPNNQQQNILFGDDCYPLIIEGVAGSGKTVVLSLIPEVLSNIKKEPIVTETKKEFFYLYPTEAILLGEKINKIWDEFHLNEKDNENSWVTRTQAVNALLPEALHKTNLNNIKNAIQNLYSFHKKNIINHTKAIGKISAESSPSWQTLVTENTSPELISDYMICLAVFEAYLQERSSLADMLSSRSGLSLQELKAFDNIYAEIANTDYFKPLRDALRTQRPVPFDMIVVDEAQNISPVALAYLIFNTCEHRVILCGDRAQASEWKSVPPLHLIHILLNRRGIAFRYEFLDEQYRCPAEVWQYTQQTVKPFQERLFGKEYASTSKILPTENSYSFNKEKICALRICNKHNSMLQHFFDQIPELSPDCFVVASDQSEFEQIAKPYLNGKNLIVLSRDQIAGLEAKTVVIFNPLDFRNLDQLEKHCIKIKTRQTKLSSQEKNAYEDLNHFHVALTRCTQNALILESHNNEHYNSYQHFFKNLQNEIDLNSDLSYTESTPSDLLKIYYQLSSVGNTTAEKFYQKYGQHFAHLLKEDKVETGLVIQSQPSPLTENSPLQEIIDALSEGRVDWDQLGFSSGKMVQRILFEQYGKRSKKKSLSERLLQQRKEKSTTVSAEQTVWQKFLLSRIYHMCINEVLFNRDTPTLRENILSMQKVLETTPDTKSSPTVKSQKSSISFKLAPCKNLSSVDIKKRATTPTISRPIYSVKELAPKFIRSIIYHHITLGDLDPTKNAQAQEFTILKEDLINAYKAPPHNLSKNDILVRIEELITKSCGISPDFWAHMSAEKYYTLREITENDNLFITGVLDSFCSSSGVIEDSFFRNAVMTIKNSYRRLQNNPTLTKESCDNFLLSHITGLLIVLKSGVKTKSEPELLTLITASAPKNAQFDYELLENIPIETTVAILTDSDCWKTPVYWNAAFDRKIDLFLQIRNGFLLDSLIPESASHFVFNLLDEHLAPKLGFSLEDALKLQDIELTKKLCNFFQRSDSAFIKQAISKNVSLFEIHFQRRGLSKEKITAKAQKMLSKNLLESVSFWTYFSEFKYEQLKKLTNNSELFHPKELVQHESMSSFLKTDIQKSWEVTMLKDALILLEQVTDADDFFYFRDNTSEQPFWPEMSDPKAKLAHGIFTILRDHAKSNTNHNTPPLVLILWLINPQFVEKFKHNNMLALIEQDAFWTHTPASPSVIESMLEAIRNNPDKPSKHLQTVLQDYHDKLTDAIITKNNMPTRNIIFNKTATGKSTKKNYRK